MNNERILTDGEIENILTVANEKLAARVNEPVVFNLSMMLAVGLIGQLQLAFRYPENTGPTRQMTEGLIRELIDTIAPDRDEVHQLLMMGFEAEFDAPTGETRMITCRNCKNSLPLVRAIVRGNCPNCFEPVCPACGCTSSAGCAEGCFWLPSGVCSTCAKDLD